MEGSPESGRSDGRGMAHFLLGSTHRRAMAGHACRSRYGNWNFGVHALHPLEQARRVGRDVRDIDGCGASRQRGTRHLFDDRAGASACSRRKSGNQRQEALGRSRGGFSTKIHLRTDDVGRPLAFWLTGGEAHEGQRLRCPEGAAPERLLGDKGYDTDAIRHDLQERGIEPVILPKSKRRIATRYEKTARAFLSML
jgi:hypothetical protein